MLPVVQLPRDIFTFTNGEKVEYRGLSRAEAIQMRNLGTDVERIEVLCIAAATGCTEEEAKTWHSATPNGEVERLVNAIIHLSGLDPDQGKADAGVSPSANGTESITSLPKTSVNP